MDTSMHKLIRISIDAIKEKITDAQYKDLCEQMMELENLHKFLTKKLKNLRKQDIYPVWYEIYKPDEGVRSDFEEDEKDIRQGIHELIVEELTDRVMKLIHDIVEKGRL